MKWQATIYRAGGWTILPAEDSETAAVAAANAFLHSPGVYGFNRIEVQRVPDAGEVAA